MKILIRDLMQEIVGIPDELKSPALADRWVGTVLDHLTLPAAFDEINCIGVGYTDATEITLTIYDAVNTFSRTVAITQQQPFQNGLYLIEPFTPDMIDIKVLSFDDKYASFDDGKLLLLQDITYLKIEHNGTYIGRLAMGQYRTLGTSVTKELGFYNTSQNRTTLSGQVIPGAGGYFGRSLDLDVRYKIDDAVYGDMYKAYPYIMRDYPYFMLLDDEAHKLPADLYRFYASTDKPISKLQSSSYRYLYSYKFQFQERF